MAALNATSILVGESVQEIQISFGDPYILAVPPLVLSLLIAPTIQQVSIVELFALHTQTLLGNPPSWVFLFGMQPSELETCQRTLRLFV